MRLSSNKLKSGIWFVLWIFIILVYLFPFIWIVMTGFRDSIDTYGWPPKFFFIPKLDAFYQLFNELNIFWYLKNSIIISSASTILTLLIASPAAYALSHKKFKKSRGILFGLLLGRVIPAIALIIPLFLLFIKLKLYDNFLGLILVYTAMNIPFTIWILRSFFMDIPESIREAAVVDGCSELSAFLRMIIPISRVGIMTSAIFIFIACWNEFIFAFTLTGRNINTITLLMKGFKTQYGTLWADMGASVVIATIPIIIFAMIVQKYFVRGLTMGAVK